MLVNVFFAFIAAKKDQVQFIIAAWNVGNIGLQKTEMVTVKLFNGVPIKHVQDHMAQPQYWTGDFFGALNIVNPRMPWAVIRTD